MATWRAYLTGFFSHSIRMKNRARVVRRVAIHCPASGAAVEVDLLMKETGGSDVVLRCSAHPNGPPACDHACRTLAEAVLSPPRALIICPPGVDPPEEID